MSEQVGEIAKRVWDLLLEAFHRRDGGQTVTDLMAMGGMSRTEVQFGLRELAAGHWVVRSVGDDRGRAVERWQVTTQRRAYGTRHQAAAE